MNLQFYAHVAFLILTSWVCCIEGFSNAPVGVTSDMLSGHIDKLALILVQGRRQLVARSRGKSVFFTPGGKREPGEDDLTALCRECREELTVELVPESIQPYGIFEAPAFGKPTGTVVRMTCYTADYQGTLTPNEEIEEIAWIPSDFPMEKLSLAGRMILNDLKEKALIDSMNAGRHGNHPYHSPIDVYKYKFLLVEPMIS